MSPLAPILIPALGALAALAWPRSRSRPWVLPITALLALLATLHLMTAPQREALGWLGLDALAQAVLPVLNLLFLLCACYAVPYLRIKSDRANRIFVATLCSLQALLSAGVMARHLGVLWVAVEGATLASVPLIHFNASPRAFEATWKYLLVGGTGVALSLLGSLCLSYAALLGGGSGDLSFSSLILQAPSASQPWLLCAWVLVLTGYGTKMGLAPMHTWKPDAYGEAPGIVGAMMAGGVTTVAFVAILRFKAVMTAAGLAPTVDHTLLYAGLFSMLIAALFLLGTRDYKRMLAYSSVEHMGFLALGASFGPVGVAAALFHTWSNALTKGALFLTASNLRRHLGASTLDEVRGSLKTLPGSSRLFIIGLFAITACPPFGPFFSELRILRACMTHDSVIPVALMLCTLLMAFIGMSRVVFSLTDGKPPLGKRTVHRETWSLLLPPVLLLGLSLMLGLFHFGPLETLWQNAATTLFPQ